MRRRFSELRVGGYSVCRNAAFSGIVSMKCLIFTNFVPASTVTSNERRLRGIIWSLIDDAVRKLLMFRVKTSDEIVDCKSDSNPKSSVVVDDAIVVVVAEVVGIFLRDFFSGLDFGFDLLAMYSALALFAKY